MRKMKRKEEKIQGAVRGVVGDCRKFWFLNRIRYLDRRRLMNLSCPWEESSRVAAAPSVTRRRHLVCRSSSKMEIPTKLVVVIVQILKINFIIYIKI